MGGVCSLMLCAVATATAAATTSSKMTKMIMALYASHLYTFVYITIFSNVYRLGSGSCVCSIKWFRTFTYVYSIIYIVFTI